MTLIPAQITFRGLARSDALEADIRKRVTQLGRLKSVSDVGAGFSRPWAA
jgi:hypothetical protein